VTAGSRLRIAVLVGALALLAVAAALALVHRFATL
jgi:hypothetical protein